MTIPWNDSMQITKSTGVSEPTEELREDRDLQIPTVDTANKNLTSLDIVLGGGAI